MAEPNLNTGPVGSSPVGAARAAGVRAQHRLGALYRGAAVRARSTALRAAAGGRFMVRRAAIGGRLGALAIRAPKDPHVAWRRFWAEIRADGDQGEVLWDSEDGAEITTYRALAAEFFDPALPLLDLGCGNGRFTRALVGLGSRVVGVDVAEAAVERATASLSQKSAPGTALSAGASSPRGPRPSVADISFLAMDISAVETGPELRERFGEANVFLRGVLHVLAEPERLAAVDTIRAVVGRRGRILIAETDFRGNLLAYAEDLGATPTYIPGPLAKAVATLPQPHHFGAPELAATFPESEFEALVARPTQIGVVPMRMGRSAPSAPQSIPGYLAVLRLR